MALSQFDLNNPLRFWSAKVTAGSSPNTRTEIQLYKIRNYKDNTSAIISQIHINAWDCRISCTSAVTNPTSYDVDSLTLYDKYTGNTIATWEKSDFTDALAIFQNHTGTSGVNYSTWVAFTQALLDSLNKY